MIQEKNHKILDYAIAFLIILVGIASRFFPHPYNFSPIATIALFGGVYLSKKTAFILPIIIMFISDLFLGFYEIGVMATVYGSFLVCVGIGFWLKNHKKWYNVFGSSLASAIIFFITTNFAVWAFTPWYAKTISGLIQCYVMGLPFFKNTLLSNLLYAAIFFTAYEKLWMAIKTKMIFKATAHEKIL